MASEFAPFENVIGRLIQDPEIKSVGDGQVARLAVSKRTGFKKDGDKYDPSDVYRIDVWDGDRDFQRRLFDGVTSLRKGQLVGAEVVAKKSGEYTNYRAWNVWRVIDIEPDESEDI